jgi:clan AA aspartic protease
MGTVYTAITLVNTGDMLMFERGFLKEKKVRQAKVNALVDTGAWTLIINEKIRRELGLKIKKTGEAVLAGGVEAPAQYTELVTVRWKDREAACEAVVLPGERDVLLGAYPLEGMDLMVHPKKQEVVGAHGEKMSCVVKRLA